MPTQLSQPRGLLLLEGLPGSGKSTLSQRVSERLTEDDVPCRWVLEESRSHPFFGPAVRAGHRESGYVAACLAGWSAAVACSRETLWILDGCALQSTVRFLYAQDAPPTVIRDYWAEFETIVGVGGTGLVYLVQSDPRRFLIEQTMVARGESWVTKLVDYVEATPLARRSSLRGVDGMVEFWLRYGELCDELVHNSALRILEVEGRPEEWPTVEDRIVDWARRTPRHG